MDDDMTTPAAAVSLPKEIIFDILSMAPVKSVCRFRCVSKGWRNLISDPVFLAEHKSRHPDPLLVDAVGHDLQLIDMDGNLVRVIKVAGGSGMLYNTSLDLICANGSPSDGAHVVDPVTGEVLLTCPPMEVQNFLGILPCYTTIGFGRAVPSGAYKMVRRLGGWSCEILTLGLGGWRKLQAPPIGRGYYNDIPFRRRSPVSINGVMYFLATTENEEDTLLCLDLESEQWREKVMEGPRKIVGEDEWRKRTTSIHITELNGSLCMVQSVIYLNYSSYPCVAIDDPCVNIDDPCVNIWLLDNGVWIKAYTIPVAPYVSRYMPLREIAGGKLLLHCSLEDEDGRRRSVLQVYDPRTGKCTDVTGTPPANLDGRIGLCNLHLERLVTANNRRRL